jgi:small-conductance mechanosensitive channel
VIDKPFAVGDFIVVDEGQGTVEKIGMKSTRVRSLSGEQLVFSNADLLKSRIRNFKRMHERRILFQLGFVYQLPYDKLARIETILREIIEAQENARFDRAHFKEFGASSLNFEVVYFVLSHEYRVYMETHHKINLAIFQRLNEEQIDFAYPTQTVYISNRSSY